MTEIINMKDIVADLAKLGKIAADTTCRQLAGGSVSQVALLTTKEGQFVVKANDPAVLQAEARFLQTYQDLGFFPKLTYIDPAYRFLLYPYLPGQVERQGEKSQWLPLLAQQIINLYQPVPNSTVWGWLEEPDASWADFYTKRLRNAHDTIGAQLPEEDYQLLLELAQSRRSHSNRQNRRPYLLHGDFGVHNFLFQAGQLSAVIDPTPVVGDPIYDLVYAFCSSPDSLDQETIALAAVHLSVWQPEHASDLVEEVLLGLYCRIGTCLKRHPADWPAYREAWRMWRGLL